MRGFRIVINFNKFPSQNSILCTSKKNRKRSSYDAFSDFSRVEAFEALTNAEDFIVEVKRILDSL